MEGRSDLPPGTIVGPYRIVRRIGKGGFGVVFQAEDTPVPTVTRTVALKSN